MNKKYMNEALKEAKKAFKNNNVPVGAVIVKEKQIIARAYNKKNETNIATHHAEILVIEKACKKERTWRLDDCDLYVTLEPCEMCDGAIFESRIKNVFYCVKSLKKQRVNRKLTKVKLNVNKKLINNCEKMLKSFFKEKRKEK